MMSMLNISLPDQVQAFLEEQANATGVGSLDEYIYQLVLQEQERIAQQQQVETLLIEGLDSGDPIEVTEDWWEEKRLAQAMLRKRTS
jgi:antitoxin ParD1/3/4